MQRFLAGALLLTGLSVFAQQSMAQMSITHADSPIKARATVDVTSASIQRGYTLTQGPALQPSLWLFSTWGLGAGAWGSMSLQDKSRTNPVFYQQEAGEFQKVDLYLYYKVPVPDFVKLELIYAEYIYPQDNLLPSPTVRDTITKISVPVLLNPFVSVSYGLSDPIKKDYYIESGVTETIFQQGSHTINGTAMTTYRNPNKETKTKQEGFGHSLASLAYGYKGIKLAANYLIQGKKDVIKLNKATEFSSSVGYTAWF